MLSNIQRVDRRFDTRGGLMIGLAALGAILAPPGADAQQQTQQTQTQQTPQRPVVPLNQKPVVNTQARPGTNGTNNNVPATQNNALQNLLRGGTNNNTATTNQQRPALNNLGNLLQNKAGTQNTGSQNTGIQNLFNKSGNQNTGNAGLQKANVPVNSTSGPTHSLPSPSHLPPAFANQPTGPAVRSRNFAGPGPAGSKETTNGKGDIVRKAADGSVIDVRSPKNGMLIHHALNGNRRVVVERPDHSRIVAASRGVQYVQHPYSYGGHTYDHRTYYAQGKVFHQLYRPYNYRGTNLDVYATSRYYEPRFYQWATGRQTTPQPFTWGYTSNPPPWFAYYKGYFTLDSSYTTPTLWLTDFLFASSLSSHYENNSPPASDAPPADGSAAITPEVKQAVAREVTLQVKQESTEAQQNAQHQEPDAGASSVVNEISDGQQHTFLADSDLDLVDPSGRRCMISQGDVVQTTGGPQAGTGTATAVILASKGGVECGRATQVEIALTDLQEMQNHMRETIDQGMANTNAAKAVTSTTPEFAAQVPPADADAPHELEQQQQLAALADG